MKLTPEEQKKQVYYRDARTGGYYGKIWTTVGKCVFCDLRNKYIFHEEHGMVMTVALYAYIDGNLMIIPRRHIKSVKELTEREWQTTRKMMYIAKKLIRKVHGLKDVQYVIRDGGAAVNSTVQDHLHIHCIPSDSPDMTVWNYRTLKHTPLENAELYRAQSKQIVALSTKYYEKYAQPSSVPISCSAIIMNKDGEVLLMENSQDTRLPLKTLMLPGGYVEDFSVPLENELGRIVHDQTGLSINQETLTLIGSHTERTRHTMYEPHLGTSYNTPQIFLLNTYLVCDKTADHAKVTPATGPQPSIWMNIQYAIESKRVPSGTRTMLRKVLKLQ